jgi:ferredoxin
MAKFKVELDEKTCIGCMACTAACENFVPNGSKPKVVKAIIEQSELKSNKDAEDGCPVQAIIVKKIDE